MERPACTTTGQGRFGDRAKRTDRFAAPADCTNSSALDAMVRSTVKRLDHHVERLVVDLSSVKIMDSSLLAAIVYLARECRRTGGQLELANVSHEFYAWATTLGVWTALRQRGVIAEVSFE